MTKPRKIKPTKTAKADFIRSTIASLGHEVPRDWSDDAVITFFNTLPAPKPVEQWPTYRPSDNMTAAIMQHRANAGLKVTMPDTGWTGYFASVQSRDEFVARAKAKGRPVQLG